MRSFIALQKTLALVALGVALTGCPVAAQKDATQAAEEKAGEGAPAADEGMPPQQQVEVVPTTGDKSTLYEFFRRRIFINGIEVWFSGTIKTTKGTPHLDKAREVRRAVVSKLRMMLTDPRFEGGVHGNGKGGLHRIIARLFGDFTVNKILINVLNVQALRDGSAEWQTVADFGAAGQTIDLMALSQGALLEMGSFALAPGKYTRVRLNLAENNKIEVNEGYGPVLRPLRTQSRAHERIELIKPFEILDNGLTTLTIDFDVSESIQRWFGTYYISPKMKILSASTTNAVKKSISAEQGGVIGVFGEIVVSIPPGALSQDAEVSLTPVMRLTPHESEHLFMIGHEYILGPSDVALLKPVTVSLAYEPQYASRLGIDPETFDLFVFDEAAHAWLSSHDVVEREGKELSTTIQALGRIGVGGRPLSDPEISGPGCTGYGEAVAVQPTSTGLDLQYFASACNHQVLCYKHGYRTYRLEPTACNDTLKAETLARCDDICRAGFDKGCSQLSEEDRAKAQADGLTADLYETCLAQADNVHQAAVAAVAERYPGNDKSTCLDYEGKGVSCAVPTCSLTVDKNAVKKGVPADLTFNLRVMGSVDSVSFDGTLAYQQEGLALPIDKAIVVTEVGRILDEARVFSASVVSPSGVPVSCSVTVNVVKDPDPCTLVFTPDTVQFGSAAGMFLKIAPGYGSPMIDLRTVGAFVPLSIGAPLPDGSYDVVTSLKPQDSRLYTVKVKNASGSEFSCSDYVTVLR